MKHHLDQIPEREVAPGYHGKFIHSDNMTVAYWRIEANNPLPAHQHPQEQIVNVLEGEFELTVDGVPHRLQPGDVFLLKPNQPHGGNALTDCILIDIFQPVREDLKAL